jgi:hypothetical protein
MKIGDGTRGGTWRLGERQQVPKAKEIDDRSVGISRS